MTPAKDPRRIRVFVSSTFRDMQEERDRLVKFTFPELRRRCRERGVEFVEVDLRWGITEEQAERGEVLPICLAEIDRCRPYFIGLLGERYGFIPKQVDPELIKIQPWLEEHRERSLTELEIHHGVLRKSSMADRAFFYFRDPAYIERLPEDRRPDFLPEGDASRDKLASLKEQIRQSTVSLKETYPDPQALGELILEDLWKAIDREFPEAEVPDPLDREAEEHAAFAHSRAIVYIGRDNYFTRLDEHIRGDGPPLVIIGESGSGKSALLANWALRYQKENPNDFLLLHFIGSTPQSADYTALLLRILGEIKRRYSISGEIPTDPQKLREAFPNWLSMAAARGKLILVLDGLNQLEEKDNAPDLIWLPEYIPPQVRLIVSTLPGRSLTALQQRGWPTYTVDPLNPDERAQVVQNYLSRYRKELSPARIKRIIDAPQSANPLFLRALLEELRLFGEHEQIDEHIGYYLESADVKVLYRKILERLEQDYEADHQGLTGKALSLIWSARRGLSEAELLEVMQIPQAIWSPLFLALDESLVSRSGLLNFFHDYLRQAVQDKYLPEKEDQQRAHLRLVDYFSANEPDTRKVDELPWQLEQAKAWGRLYELLADLPFFNAAWKHNQFEVKGYWTVIEENSPLRMIDAYQSIIDSPAAYIDSSWCLSNLLWDTGYIETTFSLMTAQVDHCRQTGDIGNLRYALVNQALILSNWGRFDEAMALYQEEERLCKELGNIAAVSTSLGNQAMILYHTGRYDEALAYCKEAVRINRERGDKRLLALYLGNQAKILYHTGRYDEALAYCKEAEQICKKLGDKQALSQTLIRLAPIVFEQGRSEEAIALYQEVERICKEIGDRPDLLFAFGGQAIVLQSWGQYDKAMVLLKEQERLCKELGNKFALQACLDGQASILLAWGRYDVALALYQDAERLCKELGNKADLYSSLYGQAYALYFTGRLEEAMALFKEHERLCKELSNKGALQGSLYGQANILFLERRLDEAMVVYKEQKQICQELGFKGGLKNSIGGEANILSIWGRYDEAMALYKEQERLSRELKSLDGVQESLGGQARILDAWGRLDEAMALYKEQERLCKELGNKKDLASSLANQAHLLSEKRNQPGEALPLVEEAYRIATEHGVNALVQQIKPILDAVRAKLAGPG